MIAGRLAAAAAALGLVGAVWSAGEARPDGSPTPSGTRGVAWSTPELRGGLPGGTKRLQQDPSAYNVPYDARFTFARIRFRTGLRSGGFFRGREAPWAHDYPRAERNFMRILHETTAIEPYLDGGNIFAADDPELFRYPVAYIVEVGFWNPGEAEVESLRAWLEKGGFLIVDDFRGRDWLNFEHQMRRVLPGARLVELDVSHPVFHAFFEIESLDLAPPTFQQYRPVYYGIFEDNDPDLRLMVVVNYNNDIGDYWEWSDVGYVPIALSNEAYKLGVNYVIYGMTH